MGNRKGGRLGQRLGSWKYMVRDWLICRKSDKRMEERNRPMKLGERLV